MIEIGIAIVGFAVYTAIVWKLAYENGKLKELVKEKEAKIKQLEIERKATIGWD